VCKPASRIRPANMMDSMANTTIIVRTSRFISLSV
jgi:hypothetical protein